MWRIVGLPWPSSRMIIKNVDSNILKSHKLKAKINNIKIKKDKKCKYDTELGVEFPSSRFN